MSSESPPPIRARRWRLRASLDGRSSPFRSYRFVLRLIGIPVVAIIGLLIYSGLRDRLVLPECDSDRARKTLSEVLKQLQIEPAKFAPIKTISSTKSDVVCSAVLSLPDGAGVVIDYRFYWQGHSANMKYSITRKAPGNS